MRKSKKLKEMEIKLAGAICLTPALFGICILVCCLKEPDWTFMKHNGPAEVYASEVTPEENSGMICDSVEYDPVLYSVNGEMLPEELQVYINRRFCEFGIDVEYVPYWLAQIYQESSYDLTMYAENGRDYGPCQLRDTYHAEFCKLAGHPEFDVKTDLFANIYIGTWIFCNNLKTANFDLETAVKLYYNSGNADADNKYWSDVSSWYETINTQ